MRRSRAKGIALLMVLVILVVTAIVGVSYVHSATARLCAAGTYASASRAKYLAESGIQHALHVLQNEPDILAGSSAQSPLGPFFADDSSDTYSFYGSQDQDNEARFYLTATATSGGIQRTSNMTVVSTGTPRFLAPYAIFVGGSTVWLPASLRVTGNLHINGSLVNYSRITAETVSATGFIVEAGGDIEGQKLIFQPYQQPPVISWLDYISYNLHGHSNVAHELSSTQLLPNSPYMNGEAVTAGNEGGVVYLDPPSGVVTIKTNVNFRGTLVINGTVKLEGKHVELEAVGGFPAIIANRIQIMNNSDTVIRGMVCVSNGIVAGQSNTKKSKLAITGGLISGNTGFGATLGGTHTLVYDSQRCRLYDFNDPNPSTTNVEIVSVDD